MSESLTVSRPPTAAAPPRRRPSATKRKQNRAAYLFVLPFFVVFVAMLVVPLVYSGYLSLFESKLIGGEVFAGLNNYVRAFLDPGFLSGVGRMALFLVVQVPIMLGLALFFALALDSGRARASKAARLLIFMPYAVPAVVATLMWGYLYGPDFGPIAQVARALGLGTPDLLAGDTILGSMMNIVTWEFVGYNMIVMFAALRSIPTELYEAAEIDGASQLRVAWSIKIPAIRPAILLTVIFSIIGTFQLFNEPSLLNAIAPDAISSAFTPNYYAYNLAFINQDLNYAAALAFLLGVVIAVVSYVVQLGAQRGERRERNQS
ncbi:multiple sugar transport system permease protein [Diaminobutyricimonas aerilata]|uniref:Multiple sugar transport system permease protein n=1 Tax=Diaminobutyricimonas aerilata TaxID=1162967 RepID=A0A2M9CF61_9MICO|nr:sugar ABC transporter permease [Diaminobutyricimonas aerilata]PJJ70564.1 multiple sugar transport system permease protein [Diaminobutyricimonas aerilata]